MSGIGADARPVPTTGTRKDTTDTMRALLLGAGNMGRAIGTALTARGDTVVAMLGRDSAGADPATLAPVDAAF